MSLSPRSHADGGAAPEGCGSCWGSGWGEQDPPHVCRVPPWAFPSSPESQHGCTESLLLQVMGIMVSLVPTASLRCMGGGDGTRNRNWGGGGRFLCARLEKVRRKRLHLHTWWVPLYRGGDAGAAGIPSPAFPGRGGAEPPPPPLRGSNPHHYTPWGGLLSG